MSTALPKYYTPGTRKHLAVFRLASQKIMKQKWYLEILFYLLPISLVFILGDKMNLVYFFLIITPSAVFYWLYLDLEKQ